MKTIRIIYYTVWVDALVRMRSIPRNTGMWKFYGIAFISTAMALKLLIIVTACERYLFGGEVFNVNVDMFPGRKLDAFVTFFVKYMILPMICNYVLILRDDRYLMLIDKYTYHGGKYAATYLALSYSLPFILLLVAYMTE